MSGGKLRELQELFLVEASKYGVFPLDNEVLQRAAAPRPSPLGGKTVFTYSGEISGIPPGSAPNLLGKSYSISAEVDIPQEGAEGMLNTNGGSFGGYGLSGKGQAGLYLRATHYGTFPMGRPGGTHAPASTPSCLTSNMTGPASAGRTGFCRWTARTRHEEDASPPFRSWVSMDEFFRRWSRHPPRD